MIGSDDNVCWWYFSEPVIHTGVYEKSVWEDIFNLCMGEHMSLAAD